MCCCRQRGGSGSSFIFERKRWEIPTLPIDIDSSSQRRSGTRHRSSKSAVQVDQTLQMKPLFAPFTSCARPASLSMPHCLCRSQISQEVCFSKRCRQGSRSAAVDLQNSCSWLAGIKFLTDLRADVLAAVRKEPGGRQAWHLRALSDAIK